ncbi:MAG: PilZ domain-containing protein [Candidatus Obscuribacterales bacterium]|nr:PilZ domain-containing protein [Steroidobacteraceae bacterium]
MKYLASDAPTIRLADIAGSYRRATSGANVPLRSRVLVNVSGGGIMRGHTVDIGEGCLTITTPTPLSPDQECGVFFAMTIAEQTFAIVGTGKVSRCSGNDTKGYLVDMSFAVEDKKSRIAIEQLFSTKRSNRIL